MTLSRPEFAKALRDGRGAALQHVLAHGLDGIEDLVLRACLEDQSYDPQCESDRGAWLYLMVKEAPTPAFFSKAVIAALHGPADDCYLIQVCELASLMGQNGDNEVAQALRACAWRQPGPITRPHAIVALDGMPALLEVARRLGRAILANPDEWVDWLQDITEPGDVCSDALAELRRHAVDDKDIAAYVDVEQRRIDNSRHAASLSGAQTLARQEAHRKEMLLEYPVERILAAASACATESKRQFRIFGRWASDADLERILDRLDVENDADVCLRLLWVFGKATLPRMHARVWGFAHGSRADLRAAALTALASLKDPRVGELGRQRLQDATFSADDDAEIELFTRNLEPGDEHLIAAALERLAPDDEQAHRLGNSVLHVCESNAGPALAVLAIWIYRTNPCTICRKKAVDLLVGWASLPDAIADEWRYDAAVI